MGIFVKPLPAGPRRTGVWETVSGRGSLGAYPYPGRPELAVSGQPEAAEAKESGFNNPLRGGLMNTPTAWESKTIPIRTLRAVRYIPCGVGNGTGHR